MTLTINEDFVLSRALSHTAWFTIGAAGYLVYSIVVAWINERRTKQQVLAESLYELASYLQIKAGFYDAGTDYDEQFGLLVRQQIIVAERQQAARDLVLRANRTPRDGLLVQVHLRMLDLYEYILSTNTDYPLLRQTFGGTPVLDQLRRLALLMSEDVESIAYELTRGRASYAAIDYRSALRQAEAEIAQLRHHHVNPAGMTALTETLDMMRGAVALVEELHEASRTPVEPSRVMPGPDMTPFLTRQRYELRALFDTLRWTSPSFRYALRITLAVAAGLFLADHLPYASHSYWILLTIVVILKPNFSMTRQRYNDRVIGTLIGCLISVVVLKLVHNPLALLFVLFLALVGNATFSTIKYRYTAICACVQVIIQINLLTPGSQTVVGERLVDTVIGGIIASLFSFVLPSWEYRNMPRLVESVLQANRRYIGATRDLLLRRAKDDFAYRVQRKQFMDSLSALIAAFQRMQDEPRSRHRAVDNLNRFIVQNYLVAAHVAAARIQVRQHYEELDVPAAETVIEQATESADRSLLLASERLRGDDRVGGRGVGFIRAGEGGAEAEDAEDATGAAAAAAAVTGPAMPEDAAIAVADDVRRARLADASDRRRADALVHAASTGHFGAQSSPRASSTGRPANALLERRLWALREDAAKIALRTGAIGRAIRVQK
jgi:uncharacterized membrane protein YccC